MCRTKIRYPHDMWKIKCVEYTLVIQLIICEGSNTSKCKNQIQGGPRVDNLWKLLAVGQPLSVGQFIHAHLPPPVQIQIQIQLLLRIQTDKGWLWLPNPFLPKPSSRFKQEYRQSSNPIHFTVHWYMKTKQWKDQIILVWIKTGIQKETYMIYLHISIYMHICIYATILLRFLRYKIT